LRRAFGYCPNHEVLRSGAIGQPSDLPRHTGEGGRQHVLIRRQQPHDENAPLGAGQGANDFLAQHVLAQKQSQPLQQHPGRRRTSLIVEDHRAFVAFDVAPRVEQPFPKGRAVLGEPDFTGAEMVAVGTLQLHHLLLGIGLDPQFEFGHIAVSPLEGDRQQRICDAKK
jgi:hypothetical protein